MKRLLVVAALMACSTPALAQMQPGEWQVTEKFTSVDMPGAPPWMADAVKQPQVHKRCVTPEEAHSGPLGMMNDGPPGCKITRQNLSDGKLDAVIVCDGPHGIALTATITGSFSPTRVDMNTNAAIESPGAPPLKTTMESAAERIGDCK